jgi:hypothetical protein
MYIQIIPQKSNIRSPLILGLFQESVYKLQMWTKPLLPKGSHAIVVLNLHQGGGQLHVNFTLNDLDIYDSNGFNVSETFEGRHIGFYKSNDVIKCKVNPSGVFMMTARPAITNDSNLRLVSKYKHTYVGKKGEK